MIIALKMIEIVNDRQGTGYKALTNRLISKIKYLSRDGSWDIAFK